MARRDAVRFERNVEVRLLRVGGRMASSGLGVAGTISGSGGSSRSGWSGCSGGGSLTQSTEDESCRSLLSDVDRLEGLRGLVMSLNDASTESLSREGIDSLEEIGRAHSELQSRPHLVCR